MTAVPPQRNRSRGRSRHRDSSKRQTTDTCLVIMFKAPMRSKRRLSRQIGTLAREAAGHLWACAYEDALLWPSAVCFAPANEDDADWLTARMGRDAMVVVQPAGNLGERINHVSDSLSTQGLAKQIFIGTDCPQLDMTYLDAAAHLLERHDAALGPARDGGVVLMATNGAWPPLRDLPWSTPALMRALESLLGTHHRTIAKLEVLLDVDSLDDLRAIADLLRNDTRPGRRAFGRWLRERRLAPEVPS